MRLAQRARFPRRHLDEEPNGFRRRGVPVLRGSWRVTIVQRRTRRGSGLWLLAAAGGNQLLAPPRLIPQSPDRPAGPDNTSPWPVSRPRRFVCHIPAGHPSHPPPSWNRLGVLNYLWIALGSALGGAARYWCQGFFARRIDASFPWGTLFVNVAGCCFIGFFAAVTGPDGRLLVPTTFRQFVMIGICGGYTTFSSFGLETLNLAREGDLARAFTNVVLSLVLCLAAVWLGYQLGQSLNRLKGA